MTERPRDSEFGELEDGKMSLAQARKRAKAKIGEAAKDQNPAADAKAGRAAPTVKVLANDFIAMQRKQGRKSAERQEKILARDVLPALGNRKARDLTRADVKGLMNKITDRGAPVLANRVHEIVRAMPNFGIEEEVYGLESNPADRLGKHRNPEHSRDRWLTTEEIGAYWKALDAPPAGPPAVALRLCLLTGQWQQNVLGMRLGQLALDDRLWIVSARTTKTGKPYKVPLSAAAVSLIEARLEEVEEAEQHRALRAHRTAEPVTWLFPKKRGAGPADLTFTGKTHRSACKRAGIDDYTPHDYRHTFATHCEQMGVPRLIWDPILGHTLNGMADLYSGFDFAEQRLDCMEKWADRIAATMGDNVVSLDRSRDKPA